MFLILIGLSVLSGRSAAAGKIEFRLVLTDSEAFSRSFEHYIYEPSESVRGRDITVEDKPFLSGGDIGSIEITSKDWGNLGRPILNIYFTKEGSEKFQAIKDGYHGHEVALLIEGKVFTVLKIPATTVRGLVFYSSRITTDKHAVEFCESIGVKPVVRHHKKSPATSSPIAASSPSEPSKVLVS